MPDGQSLHERLEKICGDVSGSVAAAHVAKLESYLRALERWNNTINLTAMPLEGFPEPTLNRLVFEPIRSCGLISKLRGLWYDLGSGGGSPAIPIAIHLEALDLVMVESRSRKAAFLREAARAAGLRSARVISDRIESLVASEAAGGASLVSLRAVRINKGVAETIQHLVAESGRVLLFGSVDWSALAPTFEILEAAGTTAVLRRRVPRGT